MNATNRPQTIALAILGAIVGGCAGYFAFFWIARQGFYGIMIPPALVGLPVGYIARSRSQPLAIVCAIAGLGLGLFTEWRFRPFIVDDSLWYFITHIHRLQPITLGLIALGTFLCYRLALGMDRKPEASGDTANSTRSGQP